MISRRKILSNSCSHLTSSGINSNHPEDDHLPSTVLDDEDVWYDKETLFRDHIQEIVNKYEQLDDEIWGKIICMERNHRVAKAYARYPIITINDGSVGFDGDTIGLCGFDNPYTDSVILSIKKQMIGTGIATAVDSDGNIIVELLEPRNVYVKEWHKSLFEPRSSCLPEEIVKRRGKLTYKDLNVIFDMKKFLKNLNTELREPFPDQGKLEQQCITVISFGRSSPTDLLDTPVWIMIINMIALEMVHTNLRMISKNNSIGSDSVKSDSDDYNCWSTPFNNPGRVSSHRHLQEWTSMTSGTGTSSGRRKYQPSNINNSGTTGTTTLARRSQTMKVSKLMNGNPRLPPSTPSSYHSYHPPGHHNTMNSRQKERPTSFHDSPFTSSSSTHRLDEQSGHSLKTQTLNTRRAGHGGTVTNYSKTPSTLFRNSSVCNLERDIGPTIMKSTKSGTVLLENRRKGVGSASTTSLWDDQNYVHRYNGNGKLGNGAKSSTKNGMLNVSPNHRHHQSLHHLPSSTPSSSSSADSSPNNNNNQRSSNLSKKHSLCHLPPPDYSDSAIDVNHECDEDEMIEEEEEEERDELEDKFNVEETYRSVDAEIEECNPIKSTGGFLNSVLRHLPLQTKTLGRKSMSQRPKRPGSSYAPSSQDDSSDGYTHIYSSINDSKEGNGSKSSSEGKRVSRTTTIPRTLRFWKSSSS